MNRRFSLGLLIFIGYISALYVSYFFRKGLLACVRILNWCDSVLRQAVEGPTHQDDQRRYNGYLLPLSIRLTGGWQIGIAPHSSGWEQRSILDPDGIIIPIHRVSLEISHKRL